MPIPTFLIKNYLMGTREHVPRQVGSGFRGEKTIISSWATGVSLKRYPLWVSSGRDVSVSKFSCYSHQLRTPWGRRQECIGSWSDRHLCPLLSQNRSHEGRNGKITHPWPGVLRAHITAMVMTIPYICTTLYCLQRLLLT